MTGSSPSGKALRTHHARLQRMIDDPECVGDLLVLGMSLAWFIDFEAGTPPFKGDLNAIARRVLDDARGSAIRWRLKKVICDDIRRYDHTKDSSAGSHWSVICGAPMIRRQGPCGASATDRELLVDHDTGRRQYIGACSRPEHKQWMKTVYDRNRRDEDRPTPPRPAANAGGVLARHLPEINWDGIYKRYDENWSPPPEDSPWRRPLLSLHIGDGDEDDILGERPRLAVLTGAGEGINLDGPTE